MARPVKPWRRDICEVTGKRRFRDHREAVQALHAARNSRKTAAELGQGSSRQECRSYACKACRGWHLTSLPAWQPEGAVR
ncbi:hypothetical protein ACQB6R_06065 [Propionibacteriaceae bacterium G1746]|uniref:hypothetical protein n=1 Tax=Aestuariimicrobium sp. G57 TaxID=3418485 RepID=UPI003C21E141